MLRAAAVAMVMGASLTLVASSAVAEAGPSGQLPGPGERPASRVLVALASAPAPVSALAPAPARASALAAAAAYCRKGAPTTAAGYARMFAALPVKVWGAADGAASVKMGTRSVWLFGDTFSTGRFVHSTAITQNRGCLHVSHGGAQLLPNDNRTHIYWIESAVVRSATRLDIRARTVTLTGTKAWAFRDGGFSRVAVTRLNAAGDLTFSVWKPKFRAPIPDPGPMYVYGPHHFGYGRRTHPELRLASRKMLLSTCQNWDDNRLHPPAAYRTIFTER